MAVGTRLSFSTNNGLYIEVLFLSPQPASQKRKSPALQELLAQHILEEVLHLELFFFFAVLFTSFYRSWVSGRRRKSEAGKHH